MAMEKGKSSAKAAWSPPRLPRKKAAVRSVTREEIDRFWRRKQVEEEERLLSAYKAAARIRAQALTEGDYRRFEQSLWTIIDENTEFNNKASGGNNIKQLVGIKDWWTKSKYAYLNQPAIKSMGDCAARRETSAYTPQMACFFESHATPLSAVDSSLGVF